MYRFYHACLKRWSTSIKGRTSVSLFFNPSITSARGQNSDANQLRRAILYVPGNDMRKIDKIRTLNVDCAVLDCEDGVAVNKKSEARDIISKIPETFDFGRSEYAVRINSIQSGLAEDDLTVISKGKRIPDTIMVPKIENTSHVSWIYDKLKFHLKNVNFQKPINLVLFVESAISLLNLREICEKADHLSQSCFLKFEGLVFGSDDFCADIGATRSTDALELLTARQMIVIIAKAFKIQAIDMVHINYKDLTSLSKVAKEGADMGFTGKQVIHPSQVSIVQKAFSPSEEKIEWARELIKQFQLHQHEGKGAFTFRGTMIDKPLLLQAENIVKISKTLVD